MRFKSLRFCINNLISFCVSRFNIGPDIHKGIFSLFRDPHGDGTLPKNTTARPDMIITKLSELLNGC